MADIKTFRRLRTQELMQFQEILRRNASDLCPDLSALQTAVATCQVDRSRDSWGYELPTMVVQGVNTRHTLPRNITFVEVKFSLFIRCLPKVDNYMDPCTELSFNIEIAGKSDTDEPVSANCFWHLDRHLHSEGDNSSNFSHPLYHFQHGGRLAKDPEYDTGKALIVEAPRLPHPPLDAILAVDFVLAHFIGTKNEQYRQLKEIPEYVRLVKEAQKRLWIPYAKGLARMVEQRNYDDWATTIWPDFIPNDRDIPLALREKRKR